MFFKANTITSVHPELIINWKYCIKITPNVGNAIKAANKWIILSKGKHIVGNGLTLFLLYGTSFILKIKFFYRHSISIMLNLKRNSEIMSKNNPGYRKRLLYRNYSCECFYIMHNWLLKIKFNIPFISRWITAEIIL